MPGPDAAQTSAETPFARAVSALTGESPPRVWSLVITLFGDLAQAPGAEIATPTLGRVLAPAGVRPEALRVALHRLRRDGWLEARRQGRLSLYRLSGAGRAESARATPRIYAAAPPAPETCQLVVLPPGTAKAPGPDFAELGRGLWLGTGLEAPPPEALVLSGAPEAWPDWLRTRLGPPELLAGYARLEAALTQAHAALPRHWQAAPDEAATLRILAVHGWRRLVLRHPDLPPKAFPEGWRAEACRTSLQALLARLPRPAPEALARASSPQAESAVQAPGAPASPAARTT